MRVITAIAVAVLAFLVLCLGVNLDDRNHTI
jgi:hypothetical protein